MSVTARTEITEVAELHGWAHSGGSAATLTRGDVTVKLWLNAAGAVHGAQRSVRGGGSTYLGRSASGKRDVVLFWLTDDPEPVAAEAAELPTVDQVAAAVQLPEWGTESAADTIARTQAVAASIASGTAASRRTAPPAAEAEPVETYRCETCGATVATVDQPEHVDNDPAHRIAELEAVNGEQSRALATADDRIAELEAQLMRATTLAVSGTLRTQEQTAELSELRAALHRANDRAQTASDAAECYRADLAARDERLRQIGALVDGALVP